MKQLLMLIITITSVQIQAQSDAATKSTVNQNSLGIQITTFTIDEITQSPFDRQKNETQNKSVYLGLDIGMERIRQIHHRAKLFEETNSPFSKSKGIRVRTLKDEQGNLIGFFHRRISAIHLSQFHE